MTYFCGAPKSPSPLPRRHMAQIVRNGHISRSWSTSWSRNCNRKMPSKKNQTRGWKNSGTKLVSKKKTSSRTRNEQPAEDSIRLPETQLDSNLAHALTSELSFNGANRASSWNQDSRSTSLLNSSNVASLWSWPLVVPSSLRVFRTSVMARAAAYRTVRGCTIRWKPMALSSCGVCRGVIPPSSMLQTLRPFVLRPISLSSSSLLGASTKHASAPACTRTDAKENGQLNCLF